MTDAQEWPPTHMTVTEHDVLGTDQVSVSECPRCGALVRTASTSKHEMVCWAPAGFGLVTPSTEDPLASERLRYRISVVAASNPKAAHPSYLTFSHDFTREFAQDTDDALRYLLSRLDKQIMDVREDLG